MAAGNSEQSMGEDTREKKIHQKVLIQFLVYCWSS